MTSSRALGWGLVLLLLAAGGGAAWWLAGDRPSDTGSGELLAPGPQRPERPPVVIETGPDRPPTPAPEPEAPRTGSVTGRVVTPDRVPLPGARVEALRGAVVAGMPGLLEPRRLRRDTVADAAARFTLADLPACTDLVLRLDGDFAPAELGPFPVAPGGSTDLGDLVVHPGMLIAGEVRDELQRPVAGARVGLFQGVVPDLEEGLSPEPQRLVLTDDQGRFSLPHAQPASFNLVVSAKGFARARHAAAPPPFEQPGRMEAFITLRPARPLTGRVLAANGEVPLKGARVVATALDQGNEGGEATSNAEGFFTIADLAPGNYALRATLAGYSPANSRTFAKRPDEPVVLRLARQGRLRGHVIDPDGNPVTAFELQPKAHRAKLDGAVPFGPIQRIRDREGAFEVSGFDPGWACVDIWAQGYALTASACVKMTQGAEVDGLLVQLVRGATLSGSVLDDLGQPVAGATVTLHLNREPEADFLRDDPRDNPRLKATRTDAEGRFLIEDLSPLAYQVEVDHPAHAILRRNDVAVAAATDNDAGALVITRNATIRGTALDAGGNALPGAAVTLTRLHGPARDLKADARGRFEFPRVAPGDYMLTCFGRPPGLQDLLNSIKLPESPLRVEPGQVLELTVQSTN